MKITQEVRDYAQKSENESVRHSELVSETDIEKGMQEKSKEFLEKGSEIYL
jgi:phosphomethylpyrimidine synthase